MFFSSRDYREYQAYLRHRRRRRTVVAVVLAVVIVAFAAAHAGDRPAARHPGHPTSRATPRHQVHQTRASDSPSDAGHGLSWVVFHGMRLPVSASDGPRTRSGELASGFADEPRGALLAAINIGVRTAALWGPAIYRPTIDRQVTGSDAGALLAADRHDYQALRAAARVTAGQPAGRSYAAEMAYRFVSWTPAAATVDVVSAGPGSNGTTVMAVTRLQVLWLRGDWRLVAPPDGDWAHSAAPVASLTGYLVFPNEG